MDDEEEFEKYRKEYEDSLGPHGTFRQSSDLPQKREDPLRPLLRAIEEGTEMRNLRQLADGNDVAAGVVARLDAFHARLSLPPGERNAADSRLAVAAYARNGQLPTDPTEQAMFLLRKQLMSAYDAADPDGTLVAAAYAAGTPGERGILKQAILASGRADLATLVLSTPEPVHEPLDGATLDRLRVVGDWDAIWDLLFRVPVRRAIELASTFPADYRPGHPMLAALREADRARPRSASFVAVPTDGSTVRTLDPETGTVTVVRVEDWLADVDHESDPLTTWTPGGFASCRDGALRLHRPDGTVRSRMDVGAVEALASEPVSGRLALAGDRLTVLAADGAPLADVDFRLARRRRQAGPLRVAFPEPDRVVVWRSGEEFGLWALERGRLTNILTVTLPRNSWVCAPPGPRVVARNNPRDGSVTWYRAYRTGRVSPPVDATGATPRVSPDGRWLGLVADGTLTTYALEPLTILLDLAAERLTPEHLDQVTDALRRSRDLDHTRALRVVHAVLTERFGTGIVLRTHADVDGPTEIAPAERDAEFEATLQTPGDVDGGTEIAPAD